MTSYNQSSELLSDQSIQSQSIQNYQKFINYHSTDSIQDTLTLLALLREIYADKIKSSAEQQILSNFSKKCQFTQDEIIYYEKKIKDDMGVTNQNHPLPILLFWDTERLCNLKSRSLLRVWVKNIEKSVFSRVSVHFIFDSNEIQIAPLLTESKLDIEQVLCFTSSYKVSEDYLGGEIAFRIEVIVFDHYGNKWIYHSLDKLILNFPMQEMIGDDKNTLIATQNSDIHKFTLDKISGHTSTAMLNQGIKNALNIPLTLNNSFVVNDINSSQMLDIHNALFNLGLNIHSTSSIKKIEIVSYPFFTMGVAKKGHPVFTDLGIEARSGISRFHLSFCYTHDGLKLYPLNTEGTMLNNIQVEENTWLDIIHNDCLELFGNIELKVNISEKNANANANANNKETKETQNYKQLVEKLNVITELLSDLKKHSDTNEKNRILKLLNKEYNLFLYMQKKINNTDQLNYIELFHTENSEFDHIKYFYLVNSISIGSDLIKDNIYIPRLAPAQVKLSFSNGKYYLTQLDAMSITTIMRRSELIPLNRYIPEVLELNDIIQMGSDVSLNLYEI